VLTKLLLLLLLLLLLSGKLFLMVFLLGHPECQHVGGTSQKAPVVATTAVGRRRGRFGALLLVRGLLARFGRGCCR